MAIYHFSAQVISRSQGRSCVAAAAYRASEKLLDERTGQLHDFTRKSDVLQSEILLPNDAPEWMGERDKLWNGVEQTEKRKDAQLAREINIALPRELTSEQNWVLAKEFVQREFVDKGMIADLNFHGGHSGNEDQPHVHAMLTLRKITPEGFGQKVRAWNDKALLNDWRENWAEHCNRGLVRHGFDIRIDHRTLEEQGINLEPQSKIGPKAVASSMARFVEHQELAKRNGERLLKDPEIALKALTHQQSTFTHHDIARFINRHTIDQEQFNAVYAKVKGQSNIVFLGKDDRNRERFTTQEMLNIETKMAQQAISQSQVFNHIVAKEYVDLAMASRELSSEQTNALKTLTQGADIVCVVGVAGTGKSYMLGAAREAWEAQGYQVHGMTLSGIAAENLEGASGIQSRTVASHLWHWERGREHLTPRDIVVVDEAGMLGSRQMAKIMEEINQSGAKLALIGDPEQLQAIEAGASYRAIAERTSYIEMTEVRRQKESWQRQATLDFASARTKEGLLAYERHDNVHIFNTKESAIEGMIEQWDEVRSQSSDKSQIMLAYTRDDARRLNEEARALRIRAHELEKDYQFMTSNGERIFAEQDRIYFLRTDKRGLGVNNGTLGTIEKIDKDRLTVRLDRADNDKSQMLTFSIKDYNDIDHGYAATIHKAQGITVDRSHVLASSYFDRHSTYVAMSRHRDGADLYYSRDDFPSFDRLAQNLSRERTKDVTLDYAKERGFEVDETQELNDRQINVDRSYMVNLTEDRMIQAEKRLAQRQYELAVQKDIRSLEKETGLSFSMEVKEGEKGIYCGLVEIVGRRYGVIEQSNQSAKLIAAEDLESRQQGKEMVIEKRTDYLGYEKLKGIQPEVRERERTISRDIEIGGL